MHIARQIGMDIAQALCVLALVFLSFAHTPIAPPQNPVLTASLDLSFCGDLPNDPARAHAPCHACRIGSGADLPPPCGIGLPLAVLADVSYGAMPVLARPARPVGPYTARGPPIA